jgi:putative ABC transport system permease protein
MPIHQLRSAVRFLGRHKGYSGINILGLTMGLCACLVIYHIVSYEFSFDRAYPDRDRIYRVGSRIRIDNGNGVINEGYGKSIPAPAPAALLAQVPHIEALAAYYPYNVSVTIPQSGSTAPIRLAPKGVNPFISTTIIASREYFDIFPYTWLAGNPAQSLSQPYSVVLTASRARDYFGEQAADKDIGRELIYDDSLHVRVSGIIKDYAGNTDFHNTDFISFPTVSHSFLKDIYRHDQWRFNLGVPGIQAFVKLSKNANAGQTAALFDTILQRHIANDAFLRMLKLNMVLQPLGDVHFNEAYDNDGIRKASTPVLYGLIGAAAFILLLAVVNFINLSTAQALQLAKDVGIRRILGASRRRLISRSLTETAILTTLSAIIALALFRPVLALSHDYLPAGLPLNPFRGALLFFVIGSIVVTAFLAGLYPAIGLLRMRFYQHVQPQNTRRFTFRRVLIVLQFSVSLVFIITSLVVGRQINYMLDADMGFKSNAVVTVTGLNASPQQIRLFARQAFGIPGVQATTVQGHAPAGVSPIQNPMQLDNRTDSHLEVNIQAGDERFIPFYGIPLLAGRNLSSGDSLREFVINDTYSKALGFSKPADALGHTLTWQGKTLPIVGVAADFHTSSLHTAIPALAIVRAADRDNSVGFRISLTDHQTLSRLETLWKSLVPDLPFTYTFLDESIARLYKRDRDLSLLVGISTAIAIFVSCIGLLGLTVFIVERKKKEVSIRKVLGAGVAQIVFLLNKEFLMLTGIALVIASPVAFLGMHRWLENFAYRVAISWWIFLVAGLIIVAVSVLTVSLRVLRAARVNPTENLRAE